MLKRTIIYLFLCRNVPWLQIKINWMKYFIRIRMTRICGNLSMYTLLIPLVLHWHLQQRIMLLPSISSSPINIDKQSIKLMDSAPTGICILRSENRSTFVDTQWHCWHSVTKRIFPVNILVISVLLSESSEEFWYLRDYDCYCYNIFSYLERGRKQNTVINARRVISYVSR